MKALRQLIVCLVVLAAGGYIWLAYVPAAQPLLARLGVHDLLGIEMDQSQGAQAAQAPASDAATPVITATVGKSVQADRITAIGDGRATRSVAVRSDAGGVITAMSLTAGSLVEAGSVIAQLQDEAQEIALELALIRLQDARNDAERIRRLRETGAVTEVRVTETEVALRNAELDVRQAEFDLSLRQVTAPIAGRIGIVEVEQGDRINAQDVLATITDRSDIIIDFRVPERVVTRISEGQQITVTPLGLRDVVLSGEISAVDTVVDRASRTLLVQGRVVNDEDLLRAGMAFRVSLSFPGETLMSIAPLAVQWAGEGPFVWAVRDGEVAQVAVTIAQRNSDSVLVRSDGLVPGDEVVTDGVQTLRSGMQITPVSREGTASDVAAEDARKNTL